MQAGGIALGVDVGGNLCDVFALGPEIGTGGTDKDFGREVLREQVSQFVREDPLLSFAYSSMAL
jgi:hypothetical protein